MEVRSPRFYTFGDYKIDARRRILTKNDGELAISSKNFDLLLELVKNEGQILTHDQLLDAVWEGTFVEQSNLKKGISALRQILGETPESSLYIKTIPRKGYSFVANVETAFDELQNQSMPIRATQIVIEEEIIEDDEPVSNQNLLPPAAPEKVSFWGKYNKFIIGGIIILSLVGVAFAIRGYFGKQGKRFSAENVKITKLTTDGNCSDASISANGNFILCGVKTAEGSTLITRQVSARSQVQLLPPQKNINFYSYKITPDGEFVYYMLHDTADSSRDGLFQIPFLGGTPRKINNSALHLTFSPDSKKMGFVRIVSGGNQILTANLDGSDEKIIAEYDGTHRIWGLNFSPDGKTLLCSTRQQTKEKIAGYVDEIYLSDKTKQRILENERMIVSATWMPDKTSIILGMRELNSEVRQIWQYFPYSKELIRVTNDNNTYRFPVLNQAGTIISVSQESLPSEIFLGETGNKEIKRITTENNGINYLSITPQSRVVFSGNEEGSEGVWTMNLDGTNKQRITDGNDGIGLFPKISNDGNSVVYASMRTGAKELWRINLDGSGLTQLTKGETDTVINGKLLSDNSLIGMSNSPNGYYLWKQNPNGEKSVIAEKIGFVWDVSPDNKLLIFDRYNQTAKQPEIVIQSIETNQIIQTIAVNADSNLSWVSSQTFVYQTIKDGRTFIYRQTVDKQKPELIFEFGGQPNERISGFAMLPDGKSFLLMRAKYLTDAVTIKIDEVK